MINRGSDIKATLLKPTNLSKGDGVERDSAMKSSQMTIKGGY